MKLVSLSWVTVIGLMEFSFSLAVDEGYWTRWYNTDKPTGTGDYEELIAIKENHGFEVCGKDTPLQGECHDLDDGITFSSDDLTKVKNKLYNPCTITGLVCQNEDQSEEYQHMCHDYEIRFQCPSLTSDKRDDNSEKEIEDNKYGMILLAAGLSIFVPIVFVIILQFIKDLRARREMRNTSRQRSNVQTNSQENSDSPPSYVEIFGNSGSSALNLVTNELGVAQNNPNNIFHISPGTLLNQSYETPGTHELNISNQTHHATDGANQNTRLPGMHLTAWDLYCHHHNENETVPPPSYTEALVILGDLPPKYEN